VSKIAVDTPDNVLTAVIKKWTATNKLTKHKTKGFICKSTVAADTVPSMELVRKFPWQNTFRFTEMKQESTYLSTWGEEDGSNMYWQI
jgi:hypothetical protein